MGDEGIEVAQPIHAGEDPAEGDFGVVANEDVAKLSQTFQSIGCRSGDHTAAEEPSGDLAMLVDGLLELGGEVGASGRSASQSRL